MALFDFNALPGIQSARTNAESMFLWGKHEVAIYRSIVLDASTTDLNNSPSTELRPGLLLARFYC